MRTINSKDNKIYKLCIQLESRKYREKLGLYLLEGPNLIEEAQKNGVQLRHVIFREDRAEALEERAEYFVMERKLFGHLAQTETSQGILAVTEQRRYSQDAFFSAADPSSNVIVLDRLQDPGNIGTILRTADAAGYGGAVLIKGTGDVYSPKVVRAAAGSLFRLPLLFCESGEAAAGILRGQGFRLVSTGFDTDKWYYEEELSHRTALIIGNEGNGVSRELQALSDCRVKIPMMGNIDSLNAAVAAGILMYESVRKN